MAGSTTIRELLVKLGVDAEAGEAGLARFDEGLDRVKENLGALIDVAVGAAAALAAIAAASIYTAVQTGEYAEQVREQAQAIGITTDAYQELLFVASKYGIDSEKITVILSKLAVDQKAIAEGNEKTAATYATLGLSMEEVAAASPEELFARMADGFGTVTDASTRLAIASELFGDRIASQLLPLMAGGSEGLAEMAKQAHALGVVMSEESIETADKFNDQVENLGLMLTGVRNEIGLALIPALTSIAERFIGWYEVNQDLIEQKLDVYATKIGDAFIIVADGIIAANDALGGVEGWTDLAGIVAALGGVGGLAYIATLLVGIASGLVAMTAGAAAAVGGFVPLVFIIGAIVGGTVQLLQVLALLASAFLIFDDWLVYLRDGDSVLGRLIDKWKEAPGLLGSLARLAESLGKLWNAVFGLMVAGWDGFVVAIQPAVAMTEYLIWLLTHSVGAALDLLTPLIDGMAVGVAGLAGALGTPEATAAASAVGGGGAIAGNPLAGGAALSTLASQYAPQAATGAGRANPYAAGTSVSVGGDTYHFNGLGLTKEQVEAIVATKADAKARMTREALAGGEL